MVDKKHIGVGIIVILLIGIVVIFTGVGGYWYIQDQKEKKAIAEEQARIQKINSNYQAFINEYQNVLDTFEDINKTTYEETPEKFMFVTENFYKYIDEFDEALYMSESEGKIWYYEFNQTLIELKEFAIWENQSFQNLNEYSKDLDSEISAMAEKSVHLTEREREYADKMTENLKEGNFKLETSLRYAFMLEENRIQGIDKMMEMDFVGLSSLMEESKMAEEQLYINLDEFRKFIGLSKDDYKKLKAYHNSIVN